MKNFIKLFNKNRKTYDLLVKTLSSQSKTKGDGCEDKTKKKKLKCPPPPPPVYRSLKLEKLRCDKASYCIPEVKVCPEPPPRPKMKYREKGEDEIEVEVENGKIVSLNFITVIIIYSLLFI